MFSLRVSRIAAFALACALPLALTACGGGAPRAAAPGDAPHAHCSCGGEQGGCACDPSSCPCHSHHGGGRGHHGHHEGDEPGEGHEHAEHHEETALSPALREFHEVMAPLWHADKGTERTEKTCAAVPTLKQKAAATADAALVSATGDLEAACAKDGRPDVEARFSAVHDAFHAAAERGH